LNTDLAEALLGKTMDWSEEILSKERYLVQLFADIKYDGYQQYSQGMKYTESLALWLNNFDISDRNMIYNFIKNNLIFISELQMRNLVELTFPLYINPILINNVKNISKENNIFDMSGRKNIYNCLQNQSLFLGLSDGSHIDIFRRSNQILSNEQINIYYDFSKEKVNEIKRELSAKIGELPITPISNDWVKCIFLLDDFSGSGISFIRKEGELWKGKIVKFLTQIREYELPYENINIYIILYNKY
jgi:hypothetical protein